MRWASALALAVLLGGCAFQAGPVKWDVCGFVGGVALDISAGNVAGLTLGCTNPPEPEAEDDGVDQGEDAPAEAAP